MPCHPFRVLGFEFIFRRSVFKDLESLSAVPGFRIWGHFPPFLVLGFGSFSAVPGFRIWGHFPDFRIGVVFRHSAIPPFHRSTVPALRVARARHTESIMTRRQYTRCFERKGNFEEAINIPTKAKKVADTGLEEDHRWKILTETR